MALPNFQYPPTVGQQQTINGTTYEWDGAKWFVIQATRAVAHNATTNRNAVGAHDDIYVRTVTLAEAIAEDAPVGTRYIITDLGEARYNVVASDDAGGLYKTGLASGRKLKLIVTDDTLRHTHYGLVANTALTAYGDEFRDFMDYSANFGTCTLPNSKLYFNNTIPASFQNGCTYVGGKSCEIVPTVFNQRIFLTQNKAGFQLDNVKSPTVNEGAGGEDDYIGGGYWRFENCDDFTLIRPNVSKSFGTGIKLVSCTDFEISKIKCQYNQFNGLELEGCSDYIIDGYKLNYNGKYSSDKSYKPLPTGWVGTHGGRGWNIAASGDDVDQRYSNVKSGQAIGNSEYGIRCFTASTKGIKNIHIEDLLCEDNGHPAGTYGTVILGSDKGVDFLVNSDATGESDNITWSKLTVNRSLGYGSAISVDGNNHAQDDVTVNLTGSALHNLAALNLFGGDNFSSKDFKSNGSKFHVSYGSNFPRNVTFEGCDAKDNLSPFNSNPSSGTNRLVKCNYQHRAATAVAGERGLGLNTVLYDVHKCVFDGYYRGVESLVSNPNCRITETTTLNTVFANGGLYCSTVTDMTNFKLYDNNFDTAYPGIFACFTNTNDGPLGRRMAIWNSNPSNGGINAGSLASWSVGDTIVNSATTVDGNSMMLYGWKCSVAGSPGTWVGIYTSTVSPAV